MLMLLKCIMKMTDRLHLFPLAKCANGSCPQAARGQGEEGARGKGAESGGGKGEAPGRRPLLYLHAGLGQVDLHGQLFPGEDVRVVSLGEHRLQRLQLRGDKQSRRARFLGGIPARPRPTALPPAGKDGFLHAEWASTCWSVKVVRFRRCFRRRKPSSKSAVEGPPKAVAPEPGERPAQREVHSGSGRPRLALPPCHGSPQGPWPGSKACRRAERLSP